MIKIKDFFYKILLFLPLLVIPLDARSTCFFIPPEDWEFAHPDMLSPRVHICFLGKNSKGLAPSVNLATEPVQLSLDAYVEEVRKIYASDPNSRWRDLGPFKTLFGTGKLIELESPTPAGVARLVQLIVIKDRVAYILTAGALKEEFSKYYKIFDHVLRSFQFSSDLISSYPYKPAQTSLRQLVQKLKIDFTSYQHTLAEPFLKVMPFSLKQPSHPAISYPLPFLQQFIVHSKLISKTTSHQQVFFSDEFQSKYWKSFEIKIINDFTEIGPYWQILLLKEIRAQLLR